MSNSNLVTIIIVNYNSTTHLEKLLDSLNNIEKIIGEIIVIDNNSRDFFNHSKRTNVNYVHNNTNKGFSKAVNQGIDIAKYNDILLLNPDTRILNDSTLEMYRYFKANNRIAAIGGKMFNGKKPYLTATTKPTFLTALFEFTNLKKIFPNNKFSTSFWVEKKYNKDIPIDVYSLCGGYMLIKKTIKGVAVRFNEEYFLYFEDLELGEYIAKLGYKMVLFPKSKILHIGGASSKNKYKINEKEWYKSRKIFFKNLFNPYEYVILYIIFSIEEKLLSIYHFLKNDQY